MQYKKVQKFLWQIESNVVIGGTREPRAREPTSAGATTSYVMHNVGGSEADGYFTSFFFISHGCSVTKDTQK